MNNRYIDMQINNLKQAIKMTKSYINVANNDYQLNYLKMQYMYLKNQLRYLEDIKKAEVPNPKIPPNMAFTIEEIQNNYNGENGKPAYVVVDNIVFDVSNVDSWGGGTHHGLYAGSDLSVEFNNCHKGIIEMLKNVAPIVGYIVQKQ